MFPPFRLSPAPSAAHFTMPGADELSSEPSQPPRGIFRPRRAASWWSRLEDLLWPEPRARDMVRRRADALAAAGVDTVVHFGFHYRFDFAPYFGLLHGLLADIAEQLHARGLRFLDHYSCNLLARPRTREQLVGYHSMNRHHVALHPDAEAARDMAFAGHRFNDLRELDVETGEPVYVPRYQCELLCHNHPDFLAMHEAYLRRHLSDIPADGLMTDDMCDYAYFRGCACAHCRARFAREFGHDLPPLADASFWGDTTRPPTEWGNYENPAFRDWVAMRYRGPADHLARVRSVIGNDRVLMTCCSSNGPTHLNSMGLSYESFIPHCDWVLLENCGLTAEAAAWQRTEPEAMLSRAVAAGKTSARDADAPCVALSYSVYEDGTYLGWAVARFWGAANWFSTLSTGLPVTPDDAKDDAELIGPYNRWERAHSDLDVSAGRDVVEATIAFARATRDHGWRNACGRDHWSRVREWSLELLRRDVGYRFVTAAALADVDALWSERGPLIVDGLAHLSDEQAASLRAFVAGGGELWIVPPLGTHDGAGRRRAGDLLADLRKGATVIEESEGPAALARMIESKALSPRLRRVSGPDHWRVRLRVHGRQLVAHLINADLTGVPHPDVTDRWLTSKVMRRIEPRAATQPLVLEIDVRGLPAWPERSLQLLSPELPQPLDVAVHPAEDGRVRLDIPVAALKIYGVIAAPSDSR